MRHILVFSAMCADPEGQPGLNVLKDTLKSREVKGEKEELLRRHSSVTILITENVESDQVGRHCNVKLSVWFAASPGLFRFGSSFGGLSSSPMIG